MKLSISEKAVDLYKTEMGLQAGDSLRLYVRVGGCGSGGFSVGVTKDQPSSTSYVTKVNDINFFVVEEDFWYLNGMTIDFDEDLNYLTFKNPNIQDTENPNS
ncbi:MAG: HesB/YadR/YfhF family protein [Anaerobacillus sp.]|uniref:HesB/YadR/YfhF family protein n=1 Tax=Anaerobacillus sp. TaxID=1872506 RepID=UPI00391CBCA0